MDDNEENMVDTHDYSVRFPEDFVEDEMMDLYPAATKPTDAIRMAVQNDVERKQSKITPATITNSVVEALEEYGGTFENIQRLEIDNVESMDVDEVDGVNVDNGE